MPVSAEIRGEDEHNWEDQQSQERPARHRDSSKTSTQPNVINIAPAYGNLRDRTIQLSQELYGLLSRQQQDQQALFGGANARDPKVISHQMANKLSWEYFAQFDGQVRQIRDDFAKLNLRDQKLEEIMRHIDQTNETEAKTNSRELDWKVDSGMVMMIARGLTDLASKLPSN